MPQTRIRSRRGNKPRRGCIDWLAGWLRFVFHTQIWVILVRWLFWGSDQAGHFCKPSVVVGRDKQWFFVCMYWCCASSSSRRVHFSIAYQSECISVAIDKKSRCVTAVCLMDGYGVLTIDYVDICCTSVYNRKNFHFIHLQLDQVIASAAFRIGGHIIIIISHGVMVLMLMKRRNTKEIVLGFSWASENNFLAAASRNPAQQWVALMGEQESSCRQNIDSQSE